MPCCDDGAAPALRAALADLRGLHAPPDPGGLDLAVLAAIALGLALAALAVAARRLMSRQSTPVRRAALADLAAARGLDPPARLFAQARLVARLARALGAEDGVGGRSPEDRAVALDRLLRTDFFTAGPGRALTRDLYAPAAPDLDAVDAGLTRLLSRIRA
ncbi:conserved hypothetical protein [Methylobacterium sp. 4-46]|uniref:DUF4381 family protein n=1 Tax=unclassified Methylobacterium TaxID=2615210 RepID=UPI000152D6E0|nr:MULTISPECIES: DUF4381 family protein [Methylobacterium]ACA15901.1 conserved hypothetical protein [Methylobacterium sp. 4-46]WFT81618.1 DUF4381 family protein [Methylobacterium nodulans]